ncbi:MAG: hypothetical protein B0D91_08500 [Oceanospirillales bacterium LUC14_002_19_P2]|nr:MAG: hypothetical protein B0D91_08500 [Oceanospirillales bacterium LUC14_002_19_P2]
MMDPLMLLLSDHPLGVLVSIVIATYILEDAAIVGAAVLAAEGVVPPFSAFAALFLGIFTGDLWLYGMGYLIRRYPRFQRLAAKPALERARGWLARNMVMTVFLVRLIPGMRLPCYLACGLFALSLRLFFGTVLVASLLWTGALFSGLYLLGEHFWMTLGEWKWLLLPGAVVLFYLGHGWISRSLGRYMDIQSNDREYVN